MPTCWSCSGSKKDCVICDETGETKSPSNPLHVVPIGKMTTSEQVKTAWSMGKDFRISDLSSKYDNKRVSSREIRLIKWDGYDGIKISYYGDYVLLGLNSEALDDA